MKTTGSKGLRAVKASRDKSIRIEKISNGWLVCEDGQDGKGEYQSVKTFHKDEPKLNVGGK